MDAVPPGPRTGFQMPGLTSGRCRKTREELKRLLLCSQDCKQEGRQQVCRCPEVLAAGLRPPGEQWDPDLRGGGMQGVICALCMDVTSYAPVTHWKVETWPTQSKVTVHTEVRMLSRCFECQCVTGDHVVRASRYVTVARDGTGTSLGPCSVVVKWS